MAESEDLVLEGDIDYTKELTFNSKKTSGYLNRTSIRKSPIITSPKLKCLVISLKFGGFGNILVFFFCGIFVFLKSQPYYKYIYIILEEVEHDPFNTILNILPSIYNVPNLFIGTNEEYELYKRTHPTILFEQMNSYWSNNFFIEFIEDPIVKKFILTYVKINPAIESVYNAADILIKKDDIENGIFVHIRYGDMLRYNIECLNQGKRDAYFLFHSDYYAKYIIKFYEKQQSNIFIFSDTLIIVKELLIDSLRKMLHTNPILLDELISRIHYPEEEDARIRGAPHIVYLFTHCRRAIVGDSTLTTYCTFINSRKDKDIILPGYRTAYIPTDALKKINIVKLKNNQTLSIHNYTYVKKYRILQQDYKLLTDVLYKDNPLHKLKQVADILNTHPIDTLEKRLSRTYPFVPGPDGSYNLRGQTQCASWDNSHRTKIYSLSTPSEKVVGSSVRPPVGLSEILGHTADNVGGNIILPKTTLRRRSFKHTRKTRKH